MPRKTRETLVALERLTDPLAVQERVVEALTQLLPGAQLELMRTSTAPDGTLAKARTVDVDLARAAASRGVLLRHQIDELDGPTRDAFARLDVDLVVPAMAGPVLYGVLCVQYRGITREAVTQARRFADLLALKLETHRLYGELETHKRLASLGTLTAALAHDLRTPLSTIRLNLQMLRHHAPALGDDAECLQMALEGVDRLNAEIETLLDFSRPLELDVESVHPKALLGETAYQVAGRLVGKGVALRTELPEGLPPIRGDLPRLVRVFANLVDNAVQASRPGSEVTMCATAKHDVVEVSVRDQGRGIAPEDLRRIFDPFFTRNADGTGLGLAITRKIVQAHRGRIRVESKLGRGTVFTVDLPRAS
jgi:signal transduction histidine kinase